MNWQLLILQRKSRAENRPAYVSTFESGYFGQYFAMVAFARCFSLFVFSTL